MEEDEYDDLNSGSYDDILDSYGDEGEDGIDDCETEKNTQNYSIVDRKNVELSSSVLDSYSNDVHNLPCLLNSLSGTAEIEGTLSKYDHSKFDTRQSYRIATYRLPNSQSSSQNSSTLGRRPLVTSSNESLVQTKKLQKIRLETQEFENKTMDDINHDHGIEEFVHPIRPVCNKIVPAIERIITNNVQNDGNDQDLSQKSVTPVALRETFSTQHENRVLYDSSHLHLPAPPMSNPSNFIQIPRRVQSRSPIITTSLNYEAIEAPEIIARNERLSSLGIFEVNPKVRSNFVDLNSTKLAATTFETPDHQRPIPSRNKIRSISEPRLISTSSNVLTVPITEILQDLKSAGRLVDDSQASRKK